MVIKRDIDQYIVDFYNNSNRILLLSGARQIGKTYSIRHFGKRFKHFIEINFVENKDAVTLFSGAKSSADILLRLSTITAEPLVKGETLIFFDEVQKCPEIVTAAKFLVEEGSYRYIMSGSLLGVELKDLRSEPVGYIGVKEMFPLNLKEFFTAMGINENVLSHIEKAWQSESPVDEFVHEKMMELYRLYLIIGGMPAAVTSYLETNNLQRVMAEQADILKLYRRDISQYDPKNKLNIQEVFDLIPPELNAKNKRFILKSLNKNAKFERYHNSFLWLTNAGVAIPVYNVNEPKQPLVLSRSRNLFKLFLCDVGLLAAQYAEGIQLRIIRGDRDINYGSVYENAVAQELHANGLVPYYYNNKRLGELDFVIDLNGTVMPIEVKSGKDYESHRALSNVLSLEEYGLQQAIVLCGDNVKRKGDVLYAPIYMTMFLRKDTSAPEYYKVDLSMLQ